MLRLIHLSDPHFSHISFSSSLFKSKRWLGFLNLFLFRQKRYATTHLTTLPSFIKTLHPDAICITGDLSSLALDREFAQAHAWAESFSPSPLSLPGNHDHYIQETERIKTYYHYFPSEGLEKKRVEKRALGKGWWWIGLDCARANSLLYSNGRFYQEMEEPLKKALEEVPENDAVVVANHFPLYPAGRPKHDLERCDSLLALLKASPQVKLYLHGHDHKPYIKKRELLAINAGSCASLQHGSFYTLDLKKESCLLKRYAYTPALSSHPWKLDLEQTLSYCSTASLS